MTSTSCSIGRSVARVLEGCWRAHPEPAELDAAHLEPLIAALAGSGAGALAWRRLRGSKSASVAGALRALQFKQALDARLQQSELARLLELLRGAGVEPLLVKGLATARHYPEHGMRASGDIDLLIQGDDKSAAQSVLGAGFVDEDHAAWDIKTRVPALYRVEAKALFERRARISVGEVEVDTLGAEDHLRVLCLHFLKHGAWRPLWLCDIAVALEARPADFNWNICLGDDARTSDSIACALGLAHELLGAFVDDLPIASRAGNLPRWLVPAVLRAWDTPSSNQNQPNPFLRDTLRSRRDVVRALVRRWPNPVQAAIERETSLDVPRVWTQVAYLGARVRTFIKRLPGSLRRK